MSVVEGSLYILNRVEIWTDVRDALLTTLKDSATELLIKYKSGTLVTQFRQSVSSSAKDYKEMESEIQGKQIFLLIFMFAKVCDVLLPYCLPSEVFPYTVYETSKTFLPLDHSLPDYLKSMFFWIPFWLLMLCRLVQISRSVHPTRVFFQL